MCNVLFTSETNMHVTARLHSQSQNPLELAIFRFSALIFCTLISMHVLTALQCVFHIY